VPTAADIEIGNTTLDSLLHSHVDHLANDPDLPPDVGGSVQPPPAVQDSGWVGPKPAVVIPIDNGLVAIRPELAAVDAANESDLERPDSGGMGETGRQ
jgi:hypothetical protein